MFEQICFSVRSLSLPLFFFFFSQNLIASELVLEQEAYTSQVQEACSALNGNLLITQCINAEFQRFFDQELGAIYLEELDQYLFDHKVRTGVSSFNSLAELYKIAIPTQSDFNQPLMCFDFDKNPAKQVKDIAQSMISLALFVKKFAIYSLGQPFSPLMNFNKVFLCNSSHFEKGMKLNRTTKSLQFGWNVNNKPVDPTQIWNDWNDGEAINPRDLFRWRLIKKLNFVGLDSGEKIDELIYQNWEYLNPVGEIRRIIRITAHQIVQNEIAQLTLEKVTEQLSKLAAAKSSPDLQIAELLSSPNKVEVLKKELEERMSNPLIVDALVQSHLQLSAQYCQKFSVDTKANRKMIGLINVANSKTLSFSVDFGTADLNYERLSKEMYEDNPDLCPSIQGEVSDWQIGLINVNLIDHLSFSIAGLGQLDQALSYLSEATMINLLEDPTLSLQSH